MGVSTRTRFEVFKRDGFRCTYCGSTPVDSALHVDHVEPVALGGDDRPSNLVTACAKCNLGKSSVPLGRKLKSKATTQDRDHAKQILEYLAIQRDVDAARQVIVDDILSYWVEINDEGYPAQAPVFVLGWVREFDVGQIKRAIEIATQRRLRPTDEMRYLCGIFRNWRTNGVPE